MSSTTTPKSVFSNTITAPIIGMAQGAYDAHVAMMSERVRILYGGQRVVDDGFAQVRVAAAASEIDAAWLQLEHNISELTRYATDGKKISIELRARTRRDQVRGSEPPVGSDREASSVAGPGSASSGICGTHTSIDAPFGSRTPEYPGSGPLGCGEDALGRVADRCSPHEVSMELVRRREGCRAAISLRERADRPSTTTQW
jgi:alkylation response protein AidB-like acyl-CoA dehydrogenase